MLFVRTGASCLLFGGTLAPGVAFHWCAAPYSIPDPKALRVGSALVTCVRKSPVRRRGFFFSSEPAALRTSIRAAMHDMASYTLHFLKTIAF